MDEIQIAQNHFSYCSSCGHVFHAVDECTKCASDACVTPVTELLEKNIENPKVPAYLKRIQEGSVTLQGVRKFVSQNKLYKALTEKECGCTGSCSI
jgi:hypothetical protein